MSKLVGKTEFKRMRYPVHIILSALSMFFVGKNSFRNIALILKTAFNVEVYHTTISKEILGKLLLYLILLEI